MISFLLTILFTNLSYSAELENFIFDNEIKIENEKLILNGLAIRKARQPPYVGQSPNYQAEISYSSSNSYGCDVIAIIAISVLLVP